MSYTINNLTKEQINIIINKYNNFSCTITNNYTLFRAKFKSSTITIYKTNVLLVQGTDEQTTYNELLNLLNIDKGNKINEKNIAPVVFDSIGSDEVGTGDFFGPIIVACCLIHTTDIPFLSRLGVRDSKEINDEKILEIAPQLMDKLKYSLYVLDNLKFNYLTFKQKLNMNVIKSILHNSVIKNLLKKTDHYDEIIVDAFTTQKKYFEYLSIEKNIIRDVKLVEKAENQYFSVAAASIIARYHFLKEFDKLSLQEGFTIPKGAGTKVDLAIEKIYKNKGYKYLFNIGKCNFKNIEKMKSKLS